MLPTVEKSGIYVEFWDISAEILKRMANITGRTEEDVIIDGLRVYLWVLHEQTKEREVCSTTEVGGTLKIHKELVLMAINKDEANKYFGEREWWAKKDRIVENHRHPVSGHTITGVRLKSGDKTQASDVYDSTSGRWEKVPIAGVILTECTGAILVRPVPE